MPAHVGSAPFVPAHVVPARGALAYVVVPRVEALPLLYPGSKLPAKFDPNGVEEAVAIDWAGALARSAQV